MVSNTPITESAEYFRSYFCQVICLCLKPTNRTVKKSGKRSHPIGWAEFGFYFPAPFLIVRLFKKTQKWTYPKDENNDSNDISKTLPESKYNGSRIRKRL